MPRSAQLIVSLKKLVGGSNEKYHFLGFGFLGCAPNSFVRAVNEGRIDVGMTTTEVRKIMGNPDEVAKRIISENDVREVWKYVDHWAGGINYAVFVNGRLIGWNLPNPYTPDIIIEQRQR